MAHVMKRRRLANPRRRRMTPLQIKYFGTKRQKAGLRNRRTVRGEKRKMARAGFSRSAIRGVARGYRRLKHRRNQSDFGLTGSGGLITRAEQSAQRAIHSVEQAAEEALEKVTSRLNRGRRRNSGRRRASNRRRANVGEILTVVPANPGRRRNRRMARARNRRRNRRHNWRDPRTGLANRRRNRRRNYRARNRRHNPRTRVVYRNRHRRMHNRRRNPGFMTGTTGAIVGVLGGAAVTKVLTGFLPSNLTTGWTGYLTTGVAAVVTGQVAGKVFKNPQFGKWMTIGGLLIVALEVVNQYFPALQLPFGLSAGTSGMGLISSSNYYVPQVNMPGSMASFVTPAGVTGAIPVVPATGMSGLGGPQFAPGLRTMRRIGRMR